MTAENLNDRLPLDDEILDKVTGGMAGAGGQCMVGCNAPISVKEKGNACRSGKRFCADISCLTNNCEYAMRVS